jgi:hypothetical protein
MGGTTGTDLRLVQGIPLTTGTEHEKDGIHGFTIIDPRPMAPQRVWLARREQRLDALPQFIWDTPVTVGLRVVARHQGGSSQKAFFPIGYQDKSLMG